MKSQLGAFLTYALSIALVLGALSLFGGQYFSGYWAVAFFVVVGLDFYRTQVVENGESEVKAYACASYGHRGVYQDQWGFVRVDWFGSPRQYPAATPDPLIDAPPCNVERSLGDNFVDRTLFNIIAAPFILPAVLYRTATGR